MLEEYINDDYHTFAKVEFNQLVEESNHPFFPEKKQSKLGWANNLFKNNDIKKNTKLDNQEENSYIKFDDVDDVLDHSDERSSESFTKDNNSSPILKSSVTSEEKLYRPWNGKNSMYKDTKSKIYFSLKRFKIKMNFLRRLTPKSVANKSSSIVDGYFGNPKYERIKHFKANTL